MSEKSLGELFLNACKNGEVAKVNPAIVLGVDVNTKDASSGRTGLFLAIKKKHEKVVDILLAQPAIDINGRDNDGWFPLSVAAGNGSTSVVAKLGRMPALRGVNDHGGSGETPLSKAAYCGEDTNGKKRIN